MFGGGCVSFFSNRGTSHRAESWPHSGQRIGKTQLLPTALGKLPHASPSICFGLFCVFILCCFVFTSLLMLHPQLFGKFSFPGIPQIHLLMFQPLVIMLFRFVKGLRGPTKALSTVIIHRVLIKKSRLSQAE